MQKRYLLPLFIILSTSIIIFAFLKHNSIFAVAEQSQTSEIEETIIKKLDSILEKQSSILKRLEDVEREVKNRCR